MKTAVTLALITMLVISGILFIQVYREMTGLTVINVSENLIVEKGEPDQEGYWRNGYWVITFTIKEPSSVYGELTLEKGTTATVNGKTVKTQRTVTLKIRPKEAYFWRSLKQEKTMVVPKTYKTWQPKACYIYPSYDKGVWAEDLYATYYVWATSSWEKYVVWEVQVYLDGQKIGEATLNSREGRQNVLYLDTDKGTIRIEHLGVLEGIYTEPQVPNIMLFRRDYIYEYSEAIKYIAYDYGAEYVKVFNTIGVEMKFKGIKNKDCQAYSCYWYGYYRWTDNPDKISEEDKEVWLTPAAVTEHSIAEYVVGGGVGWTDHDSFWDRIVHPITPVIFPEEKATFESQELKDAYCLVEYLNQKTENLAGSLIQGYSWELVTDENGTPQAIKVHIPYGKLTGLPLATAYIPTELVDTIVYQIPQSKILIEDATWDSGKPKEEIYGTTSFTVTLKQYGSDENTPAGAIIKTYTSTSKAEVTPYEETVSLAKGETKTLVFYITNLGVEKDFEGTVTIKSVDVWNPDVVYDETKLYFVLKVTSGLQTSLKVKVVEKQTQKPISGLTVWCVYSGKILTDVTDGKGYADFPRFEPRNYIGQVTIKTEQTDKYKQSVLNIKLKTGANFVKIEVELQGEEEPKMDWMWILIIIGILTALLGMFVISRIRRGRRR